MGLSPYFDSAWSVLPAVLTITLAIVTHRVLLSISLGAILGALMLYDFNPTGAGGYLIEIARGHFYGEDGIHFGNLNIVSFLFLMGVMIQLMSLVKATGAFASWAGRQVGDRRSAKWLICVMALIFFIDDYFHSLAAGNISRPIADRYRISRAKLAYLLDSTAAPICVVTPVSSWGAYIIALLVGIFSAHGLSDHSALSAFLSMIPMIFYTFFTLLMIGLVCLFDLNIGPMLKCEEEATQSSAPPEEHGQKGSVWLVLGPIGLTTLATIGMILYTGSLNLEVFSIIGALENTNMEGSLLFGSIAGLIPLALALFQRNTSIRKVFEEAWKGVLSMWPAVCILLFAWTIGQVILDLGTGTYLASLANAHIPPALLPCLVFFLAAFMAFSTGTSWGTFGIMLPLAADIALQGSPELLLPLLSAVLSGAVFGDHCSPISDTTILSASGAGCHHMKHVITQLPYASISASLAGLAYLTLGYTGSVALSLLSGSLVFALLATFLVVRQRRMKRQKVLSTG